ncbi:outer membrane beta-barrel protein [Echinicola shivajiensis]|uniref:outer membrane beta-barrel protein n=1 Tax=Echinicola shivajiensis TaxID=1035916 RepID=UPI001BFC0A21|nr:outer membrane beta-barrel protein [Echinicola shivajiensis]
MKKLILIFVAVLIATMAHAQVELKPTIGLTFSNVTKDPDSGEAKAKIGYQFGASVLFGDKFYVEPGLFFAQKSTKFSDTNTSGDDLDMDLKGLRIPVAVGYHLLGSEDSAIGLRVFGGGSTFIVTGVNGEGLDKDDFESPTWGVFAGAGLDFTILFLDAKYEWSLTDVSGLTDFDIGKTNSFFVNAGIRLSF